MIAVAISSGLTGIAGVWYAFYYNNLFAESTFGTNRSIELILGTIVGGVGTLFGPIVGAFLLTPLGEMLTGLTEGTRIDGIKQFFWGLCVAIIVLFRPSGVWPWIARRAAARQASRTEAAHDGGLAFGSRHLEKLQRSARRRRRLVRRQGRCDPGADRPERRRQDHDLQHDRGRVPPRHRRRAARRHSRWSASGPTRSAMPASAAPSRSCGRSTI